MLQFIEVGEVAPPPKPSPGARFSKVPVINGPGKLSPFTLKTEVSIVLHITRQNCQLMKQNGVVC